MPSFQYTSDLHLDLLKKDFTTLFPKTQENLILAGDIAQLDSSIYFLFLTYLSQTWTNTFILPGNHEYYGMSIHEGNFTLKSHIKKFSNIFLLQNNIFEIDEENKVSSPPFSPDSKNTKILGCTLWSKIPKEAEDVLINYLNDFRLISGFTPRLYNFYHEQDRKWLERELEKLSPDSPCIIVTHHAPLLKGVSNPKYEDGDRLLNYGFSSDCDSIFDKIPKDSWWIFGHTHFRTVFKHKGVNVTTHALGYGGEKFKEEFSPPEIKV